MKIIDALAFVGDGIYKKQSAGELLALLDKFHIDKAIIAPVEEYITVYNTEGNRYISELVKKHPDRFLGYAVANPWYGKKAADELRNALSEGLSAVYFDSSIQGFSINDKIVYPLIEICAVFNVPVYFHTGTPAFALPFGLHYLAKAFPDVRFIMGHCGANDFVADVLPSLYNCNNIWLESSMNLTISIANFSKNAKNRFIFGSAVPRSDYIHEFEKIKDSQMSGETLESFYFNNVMEVLGDTK